MLPSIRFTYFSDDQLRLMKTRVFELLEKNGVKIDHPEVLEILAKAGAGVDFDSQMVRFPERFLVKQIEMAPKTFTLAGRNGKNELKFPREDGTFHTRTGTGAQSWLDVKTGEYRGITIADVATWGRLVDRLDEISFCAFPVAGDVPSATADVHALKTMLQNIEKHIWIQPYTGETVEFLIRLLIAAAGGKEALRASPPASFITCALTPLDFKHMDMEIILQAARHGIPLHPCSLPSAGSTGPITTPGIVLLAAAENLAMLATAQAIQPGIPIIATSLQFSADMRTGRSLQSSVEALRQSALFAQFMKAAFEIPVHTYGSGSDSPDADAQCMSERALQTMLIALSGADVLGAAGQLETATTISPVQLVIDNEVFAMVRGVIAAMPFDDEVMAWDELLNCKPGSQFLTSDHTFKHCRDSLEPINFTRLPRDSWQQKDIGDLIARADAHCKNLLTNAKPADLPEDVSRDLDSIVKEADAKLK